VSRRHHHHYEYANMARKIRSEFAPAYVPSRTRPERMTDDAMIEYCLAVLQQRMRKPGTLLTSPGDVRSYLRLSVATLEHEVFGCLFLDNQHGVIRIEELFRGTIDGASVYPREVVKAALACNAAAVVFYHNHPSGMANPSQADRNLTDQLRAALKTVDIRVLDHFIVPGAGDAEPYSFAENGLI
jgi:DNA repair protein RadC